MLHTEEVEILLPEKDIKRPRMPLILTLGPALTMALPVLMMALLSGRIYGKSGSSYLGISLATGLSCAFAGALWAFLNHRYREKEDQRIRRDRKKEFREYLKNMDEYLSECREDNRAFLFETYKDPEELLRLPEEFCYRRYHGAKDFLYLRAGTGSIPFQMNVHLSENVKQMFPDEDVRLARALVEEYQMIENAPVLLDLRSENILGVAGKKTRGETYGFLLQLVLQLAVSVSPQDVKLVLFFDGEDPLQKSFYEKIRFLPHTMTEDRRLLAGSPGEASNILPGLSKRAQSSEEEDETYFFLILHEPLISGESTYRKSDDSVIFLADTKEELPRECRSILHLPEEGKTEGYFLSHAENGSEKRAVRTENVSPQAASDKLRHMRFPKGYGGGSFGEDKKAIPEKVSFSVLYGAESLEVTGILKSYRTGRTDESLRVPIGIRHGREKLFLDLHERFHGPHGLVAGTTGSGKSELLQTVLVSLCLTFSSEDISFFLIDYKGGGTGKGIDMLPHCAGSISNLSGNAAGRAMLAIGSENRRRQELFSRHGVSHIDEYTALYRRGSAKEALPHLILIIDEFAELKKEEPEFMQQIISLAAVGRSLGIHLILATQKPAGVVDDKILSNTHFRLCLKVQDRQDSLDMLHRPEAAFLVNPGRCYLQVGNNELFREFQTGYLGGNYHEEGEEEEKLYLITQSGIRIAPPAAEDAERKDAIPLLKVLTERISQACLQGEYQKARKLWMEELPDIIEYPGDDTGEREIPEPPDERILIGKYDDPGRQKQGWFFYEPSKMGHLIMAGGPASGKSSALLLILSQLAFPFLLIDVSQKQIFAYAGSALCRGVLEGAEGIPVFFHHLRKIFADRKEDPGAVSEKLFIVIDNFGAFFKELSEEDSEFLVKLLSEGIGINILFVMSGTSPSEFPSKIFEKVKTTLSFEMNDRYQYGDLLRSYRLSVTPKPGTPGRCLFRIGEDVLECQTAFLSGKQALIPEKQTSIQGKQILISGKQPFGSADEEKDCPCEEGGIPRFPSIPRKPVFEDILQRNRADEGFLSVGWSLKTGYIRGIDLSCGGTFLVSGSRSAAQRLLSLFEEELGEDMVFLSGDEKDDLPLPGKSGVYLIASLGALIRYLKDPSASLSLRSAYEEALKNASRHEENGAFFIGAYDPSQDADILLSPLFAHFLSNRSGIHLGGNVSSQRALLFPDLTYSEQNAVLKEEEGYMRLPGKARTIRVRIPDRKGEEDRDDYD